MTDIVHRTPYHPVRMREDSDTLNFVVGIHCIYNAVDHLFTSHKGQLTKEKDLGDYYAILILKAVHVLMSQGKKES